MTGFSDDARQREAAIVESLAIELVRMIEAAHPGRGYVLGLALAVELPPPEERIGFVSQVLSNLEAPLVFVITTAWQRGVVADPGGVRPAPSSRQVTPS